MFTDRGHSALEYPSTGTSENLISGTHVPGIHGALVHEGIPRTPENPSYYYQVPSTGQYYPEF